jgi:hypothetical protein
MEATMSSYVLTVNERNAVAKRLLDYLKSLSSTSDYMDIAVYERVKSPYDPEFVSKIQRSMKSKGKSIKLDELWK